jgi:TatD DNase family protein
MIDSHCHLADDVFAAGIGDVVARAGEAGVHAAICILDGTASVELGRVDALRTVWPALAFTVGVHPHRAGTVGPDVDVASMVGNLADQVGACAIGEVGLDYHYDFAPRAVQRDVFAAQVRLARERSLPIVIHTREADADTVDVLERAGGGDVRGVFHCFTGNAVLAARALALGFHLSFSGIVTFPRAQDLRAVAADVPRDRVLIETDSPYLAPVPHRGRRNEPGYVGAVARTLAELWQVPIEDVQARTAANTRALFRW